MTDAHSCLEITFPAGITVLCACVVYSYLHTLVVNYTN